PQVDLVVSGAVHGEVVVHGLRTETAALDRAPLLSGQHRLGLAGLVHRGRGARVQPPALVVAVVVVWPRLKPPRAVRVSCPPGTGDHGVHRAPDVAGARQVVAGEGPRGHLHESAGFIAAGVDVTDALHDVAATGLGHDLLEQAERVVGGPGQNPQGLHEPAVDDAGRSRATVDRPGHHADLVELADRTVDHLVRPATHQVRPQAALVRRPPRPVHAGVDLGLQLVELADRLHRRGVRPEVEHAAPTRVGNAGHRLRRHRPVHVV